MNIGIKVTAKGFLRHRGDTLVVAAVRVKRYKQKNMV